MAQYKHNKPNGVTLYSPRLSKIGINLVMDLIENRKIFSIKDINSKNFTMVEKFELSTKKGHRNKNEIKGSVQKYH